MYKTAELNKGGSISLNAIGWIGVLFDYGYDIRILIGRENIFRLLFGIFSEMFGSCEGVRMSDRGFIVGSYFGLVLITIPG